ncbi:hypothetical protein D5018_20495 [Parashewanella curva]|uniref:Uncharacterized protein n=1 Tax=Parashewanella curva TaxID=2338552 RepID=A0A3L8PR19_9GAMM|nr:hypothetical protein [Parashewanella curva]RLV57827.1 hypothetical protein D5018_20495 [Parashewanella curva]
MSAEKAVYQFIYSKKDDLLKHVNIFHIRVHLGKTYSEEQLQEALSSLVAQGKIKTNARSDEKGLTSYWVRYDPDKYSIKEDKNGFVTPCSPSHSLQMLNNYMRTDLLQLIHVQIHKFKELQLNQSPLVYLINSLSDVIKLVSKKGQLLMDTVCQNPFHHHPIFDLEPSTDSEHDIKLMRFHLNELKKIQMELDDDL